VGSVLSIKKLADAIPHIKANPDGFFSSIPAKDRKPIVETQ
jgi:hypothetical protein